MVGEPCEGGAAHGEVGVMKALGGQWLGVAEDGLDEAERSLRAEIGAPSMVDHTSSKGEGSSRVTSRCSVRARL